MIVQRDDRDRLPRTKPMERLENRSAQDFAPDAPFLTRAPDLLAALPEVSFELLRTAMGEQLLRGYRHLPLRSTPIAKSAARFERIDSLSNWIERLSCTDESPSYVLIPTRYFKGFWSDAPRLPGGFRAPEDGTLWMGAPGVQIGLHYDYAPNFIVQLEGEREFVLGAPDQSRWLYPFRHEKCASRLDDPRVLDDRFPRYSRAEMLAGVLRPGDVLYIPAFWWHYLVARTPSIAVNAFVSQPEPLQIARNLVQHFSLRDNLHAAADALLYGIVPRAVDRRFMCHYPTGGIIAGDVLHLASRRMPERVRAALDARPRSATPYPKRIKDEGLAVRLRRARRRVAYEARSRMLRSSKAAVPPRAHQVFEDFPFLRAVPCTLLQQHKEQALAAVIEQFEAAGRASPAANFAVEPSLPVFHELGQFFCRVVEQNFCGIEAAADNDPIAWAYVQNADDWVTKWHDHVRTSTISGVIYLNVPDPEATIRFATGSEERTLAPEEGKLYFWPNWLQHTIRPQSSMEYRVSINIEYLAKNDAVDERGRLWATGSGVTG